MKRQIWNSGWKFWRDRDTFALLWMIPENARDIELPHDAMIEGDPREDSPNRGNTGYRDGDSYTYVKVFEAPEEWRGQCVLVYFEGVYMNAMVYLNGQYVAKNPYGYTGFYADLTDCLRIGQVNELRVLVRAGAMPNSRWYSGAGIYRDVYLMTGPAARLEREGARVFTERIEADYAVVCTETPVLNGDSAPCQLVLETRVLDASGNAKAVNRTPVFLGAGERRRLRARLTVQDPCLWEEDSPCLYRLESVLLGGEGEKDRSETSFGIRTVSVDARRGLLVNGKSVKLRGACIHHDSGLLGAATFEEAEYRQVRRLKEAGFNAIRMSHHPMAEAMLRACDALGVYVMDELTDMWNRTKSDYDYGLYFEEWWRRDVEAMVDKDFNHPSVILYSIGNEIPEIGTDIGSRTAHEISTLFHGLDPTRFTTAGINGVFAAGDHIPEITRDVGADAGDGHGNVNDFLTLMDERMDEIVVHRRIGERLDKAVASLDVAGYNYMTARYEKDAAAYPDRVMVGTETYPPEIARNWGIIKRLPQVIGDFTWTGWDYIGEAGVGIPGYHFGEGGFGARFPAQLAYCGDIDLTGFRRPASYFREIVFGKREKPFIAVQAPEHYGETLIKTPWVISDAVSSWTFRGMEGKPVVIEVYAPGDETELFLNGRSLGRKPSGEAAGFRTLFDAVYEAGTLEAVVRKRGEDGEFFVLFSEKLESAGAPRCLRITKEADSRGRFAFFDVELVDDCGRVVTDADEEIRVTAGPSRGVFFGSGDPKPADGFCAGRTRLWNGRALLIVRKDLADGERIRLETAGGLAGETGI